MESPFAWRKKTKTKNTNMSKNLDTKIGKVRAFLEEGNTLTSWRAIELFRCTRLSAVIYALRNDYGMAIADKRIYEEDTNYSKYWLTADPATKNAIKDYLLNGKRITEEIAKEHFDCDCIKVVVNELREEGLNIVSAKRTPLCGKSYTIWYTK